MSETEQKKTPQELREMADYWDSRYSDDGEETSLAKRLRTEAKLLEAANYSPEQYRIARTDIILDRMIEVYGLNDGLCNPKDVLKDLKRIQNSLTQARV